MQEFIYGEVPSNEITININELCARLNVKRDFKVENIEKLEEVLRENINAKYVASISKVEFISDDIITLGNSEIKSKSLYKNLKNVDYCYILAVTLGINVDKLLKKYSIKSTYEHFVLDALSSAMCESLCDIVSNKLCENKKTRPRFSVGYGDLSLEYQKQILDILDAKKYLNLTLLQSFLMVPTKSITAIIGIENGYFKGN